MTRIVAAGDQIHLAFGGTGLAVERVMPNDRVYSAFWARHYTGSKGAIGRQLHYLCLVDGKVVGICAAGEAMYRNRVRDRWFKLEYETVATPPPRWLASCIAFRVEDAPRFAASALLALWRAKVVVEWPAEGFETTVGPPLSGACFRHDGWKKAGYTSGRGSRRPEGHGFGAKRIWIDTPKKMVLCRWADGRPRDANPGVPADGATSPPGSPPQARP